MRVAEAIGPAAQLLTTRSDVTRREEAEEAAAAAVERFGRIGVLVNNAGLSYTGFFEEMPEADLEGWMGAGHEEVAPFGIHTTVVNPGSFRADLISERSMSYADALDLAERKARTLLEEADAYRDLSTSLAHEDLVER